MSMNSSSNTTVDRADPRLNCWWAIFTIGRKPPASNDAAFGLNWHHMAAARTAPGRARSPGKFSPIFGRSRCSATRCFPDNKDYRCCVFQRGDRPSFDSPAMDISRRAGVAMLLEVDVTMVNKNQTFARIHPSAKSALRFGSTASYTRVVRSISCPVTRKPSRTTALQAKLPDR